MMPLSGPAREAERHRGHARDGHEHDRVRYREREVPAHHPVREHRVRHVRRAIGAMALPIASRGIEVRALDGETEAAARGALVLAASRWLELAR